MAYLVGICSGQQGLKEHVHICTWKGSQNLWSFNSVGLIVTCLVTFFCLPFIQQVRSRAGTTCPCLGSERWAQWAPRPLCAKRKMSMNVCPFQTRAPNTEATTTQQLVTRDSRPSRLSFLLSAGTLLSSNWKCEVSVWRPRYRYCKAVAHGVWGRHQAYH